MVGWFVFRVAWRLLRGWSGRTILGLAFSRFHFLLPVRRVHTGFNSSDGVLAFYHPAPAYPVHILIVPRRRMAGLHALGRDDGDVLVEILRVAQALKGSLNLPEDRTRLIVNGGAYQDLPHLHFHLIVENGSDQSAFLAVT